MPRTQEIPVLFIRALDEALDKVRAFSLGGVDYIPKPFQPEDVLALLHDCQSLAQSQRPDPGIMTCKNEFSCKAAKAPSDAFYMSILTATIVGS